jgi:glycosyltransferase involved in cell wall biosynthesis
MTRVVLNGRFLAQKGTGVQRYARETLLALDSLLGVSPENFSTPLASITLELCVPADAVPVSLRHIQVTVLPGLTGHAWEQLTLAWHAGRDLLVGFNYSGPILKRHQIITVHDATVAAMPCCFSWRYRAWHNGLLAMLKNRVASIMTVSEFSARELRARYGVRNRIVVGREGWSHAVSHVVAQADDAAVLAKHGLSDGRYVLLVGSIKPNKNLEIVARALERAPQFPWPVAVAGAPDTRIFSNVADVSNRLRLLGFVSDVELGALYRHAAWFLFPSLYEGFGLPALEAMANGCPVLAAAAGSLPEVCADAALFFDPRDADALAGLLLDAQRNEALRSRVRARAAGRLSHYTWEANAQILLNEIFLRLGVSAASRCGFEGVSTIVRSQT